MAEARIIDYYSVLSLPPTANLIGISNAYARLSDEYALNAAIDQTVKEAIVRLNEAYAVLSNPETRRKYDLVYFSGEKALQERKTRGLVRRRRFLSNVLVAILLMTVLAQGAVLGYLGREQVTEVAQSLLGPLFPGEAN